MASIINATTSTGLVSTADNSGSLQLATNNGTTAVTIDTSQNVGIGTTSPAVKFDVTGTVVASGLNARITNLDTDASARAAMQYKTGASSNVWQTFAVNGALVTGVAGVADYMRIDSNGNLLVGTTSTTPNPGVAIQKDGNVTCGNSAGGSGFEFVTFRRSATQIGSINQNGTTAVQYLTSSDYRLKENITPMTGALNKVTQLKPVTYKWKTDGSDGQGFIAHELQAVVPDAVSGEKDAVDAEGNPIHQGIDTSFLVATLTAAIQELNAKVEAQAVRIAELEGAK